MQADESELYKLGTREKRYDSYYSHYEKTNGCTVVRDYLWGLIIGIFLALTAAQIGMLIFASVYRKQQHTTTPNDANIAGVASGGENPALEGEAKPQQKKSRFSPRLAMSCLYYVAFFPWLAYSLGLFFCLSEWAGSSSLLWTAIIGCLWVMAIPIIIIMESWCSPEKEYISHMGNPMNVEQQIEKYVHASPVITMVATGYHLVTTTHTSTDSRGRSTTRTSTTRVVTRVERKDFVYSNWNNVVVPDASVLRTAAGITKVKGELTVQFGDTETSAEFDRQHTNFKELYKAIDTHVDFTVEKTIPGFEARLMEVQPNSPAASWVNMSRFRCWTFLLLGWCYRLKFRGETGTLEYKLVKDVFLHGSPAPLGFEPYYQAPMPEYQLPPNITPYYATADFYSAKREPDSMGPASGMAAQPPGYEEAFQLTPFLPPSSDGHALAK
jgi:hypothetical protein